MARDGDPANAKPRKTDLPPRGRPKHQTPEIETLLRSAERQGWRVERGSKHFKLFCPCPERHIGNVATTPSSFRTPLNFRKKLEGMSCWTEEE